MMPLKYSNFLVAATAVLPVLSTLFLAPVYVIISLQYGKEVVKFKELFCWLSCTVMAGVVNCVWVIVTFSRTD